MQHKTVAVNVRSIPGPQIKHGEGANRAAPLFSGVGMTEACDWGEGRLLAYTHHTLVVVVDPGSNQVVQTLDGHVGNTTAVRFLTSTADVLLATGDNNGHIIVWQVREGSPLITMSCTHDVKYADSVIAMRQVKSPAKTTTMSHIVPFRLLCLTAKSLILLDLSSQSTLWRSEMGSVEHPLVGMTLSARENCIVFNSSSDLRIIPKIGSPGASYHSTHLSVAQYGELQDVVHCPSVKSQVYLVFRTEIILYDIEIKKQIETFSISSGRTEFRSLITASGAELSAISTVLGLSGPLPLYTLHNDGTMSTWVRNPGARNLLQVPVDFRSSRQGFAGRPHLVAMERVQGAEIGGSIEGCRARFAVVANDGTLTTWEYTTDGWCVSGSTPSTLSPVSCTAVMNLAVGASETKLAGGEPNCLVILTTTGLLMLYEILTGALVCKLELATEKGCVPLSLQYLNPSTILVGATKLGSSSPDAHHNFIASVSLPSLNTDEFKGTETDSYKLLGLEVSPRKMLLAALHAGGACEIWDIPGRLLLHKIVVQYTVIKWMPALFTQGKDPEQAGEIAIWLSHDGLMSFFRVVNGEVRHYRENPSFMNTKNKSIVGFGYPVVSADWYDLLLLTGDTAGMMCLVNLKNGKFSHIDNQQKAAVKTLKICPPEYLKMEEEDQPEGGRKKGTCLALVLFEDEEFGIWNVGAKQRLSYSKTNDPKTRPLKATAVEWVPGGYPTIATPTGTIMILDLSIGSRSSPVTLRSLARPIVSTALLVRPHAAYLAACLMDCRLDPSISTPTPASRLQDTAAVSPPYRNAYGELILKKMESEAEQAAQHLQLIPETVKASLLELADDKEDGFVPRRCLITAAIFAEDDKMQFWRSAEIALREAKNGEARPRFIHPTIVSKEQTLKAFSNNAAIAKKLLGGNHDGDTEDGSHNGEEHEERSKYFDTDMMEGGSVGAHDELFLDDGLLHAVDCNLMSAKEDAVRRTKATHQYDEIAKQHVNLGAMYPACQLLLDTPTDAPEWRANLYKACVVAAGVSPLHYQHTVKRVASLLVGNEDIDGAVEMLCLVGRGHEACKAYQSHDRWEDAARLAKVSLTQAEANDILQRWAVHLSSTGDVLNAACVMVSIGNFPETLRLLAPHAEYSDVAGLLAYACEKAGLITPSDEIAPLIAAVYSQYKDYLNSISAHHIAELYSDRMMKWRI
eukprot:TRINITY_DN5508_c1_g1_i1.p1 TRINITY_DN5508_c1_g1~~TRINITY_DN5508_c1_g1_i1.p1  ORF type:complete len:1195 (+),score=291.55 TRINITY_DN5508_c1_g1_i1:75-3659(+)